MLNNCKDKGMPYMQFDSEKYIIYDKNGKIVKNIYDNIICPYENEDEENIEIENEIINEEEDDEVVIEEKVEEDELSLFYDTNNKGKLPLLLFPINKPNNPLVLNQKNLAIQILEEDFKNEYLIKDLDFVGWEYITSKKQFHRDLIYISKLYFSNEIFMLYYSKKKKKFIPKIISSYDSKSTFKNDKSYLYDKYFIIKNEISL